MTKYEQLKERIVKYVPEIMELKFGCNYTVPKRHKRLIFTIRSNHEVECIKNLNIIILGRPITLEDVLMVINKHNYFLAVSATGAIYNHITGEGLEDKNGKNIVWKLNTPLHEQSEEIIDKLLEIIK